ncbi:NAD(P)/FAD-dependent oxidoreductase [Acidobacteriota bacterium]
MELNPDVLVIGGGAIGVCCAYYLVQQNLSVALIEQEEIASGCSEANAGLLVASHAIPLASPGALSMGLKSMLKPASPFYIRPRIDFQLFRWLWLFARSCKEKRMLEGLPVLKELNYASQELYNRIIQEEKLDCDYGKRGWLLAYKTGKGFQSALKDVALLQKYDVATETLNTQETLALEPTLKPDMAGGIFHPHDAHLDPKKFVASLADRCQEYGGTIQAGTKATGFEIDNGQVTGVKTTQGLIKPKQIVLTVGAWSKQTAQLLGSKLPVQPAKGYSITIPHPSPCPQVPLYLSETKVAVTPLKDAVRLGGTLELAGMTLAINRGRVSAIRKAAEDYMVPMETKGEPEIWSGLRPCSPDGLPLIGRLKPFRNVLVATGHAMLGMHLAPVTGKLIAQVACAQKPDVDLTPFRVDRFH